MANFGEIEAAIQDIRDGKMVIVTDSRDRENEGDLVMAAERVTPEAVNFMVTYGRGLVCVPLSRHRLEALDLPPMTAHNTERLATAFTVSVDASNVSTGISAPERAETISALIDPETEPNDLRRPGHIFPLRAMDEGVLRRAGHTEAAVDLAGLAGLNPAGIICEVMSEDGNMARLPELKRFAATHGLRLITIADLIRYRLRTEKLVRQVAEAELPTRHGTFRVLGYESTFTREGHIALVKGEVSGKQDVLVRVHSECLTGDVFGSVRCDCGEQLASAMHMVGQAGEGVILYMRQEGRGIGLMNKIRAYALQDGGLDTVEANERLGFPPDLRDYGIGAQILVDLGLTTIRILTNNPRKIVGLGGYGLTVTDRVPIEMGAHQANLGYLSTKRDKLGHYLTHLAESTVEPKEIKIRPRETDVEPVEDQGTQRDEVG